MSKELRNLKADLRDEYFNVSFLQKTDCSEEENKKYLEDLQNGKPLPEGVFQYGGLTTSNNLGLFYAVHDSGLTDSERQEYIQLKKLSHLKTIKNCVVFFTVLQIIAIVAGIIIGIVVGLG